ncbi:hypothetical protein [Paenibacillus naphthalenovorans]|uniref:hypothetical protein n=1 Tax=Paenibacillus naphthalenovorans TaxID=162209 RepID=UPI003D2950A7
MPRPAQGFDVSVQIVGPNGPELVGEYQEMDINIKNDVEEYLEMNERIAAILDGEIKIDGKLKRGLMNMDVVRRVYGTPVMRRGERIPPQPRFVITFSINAPEKGLVGRFKLLQVIIPDLTISAQAGKGVVSKELSYRAEGIENA